jgi:homocysteine S-methyltransferase
VIERMRLAQEQGTPAARAEGVAIAAEMVEAIKDLVQGVQVTAPAGRIGPALDVLRGLAIPRAGS